MSSARRRRRLSEVASASATRQDESGNESDAPEGNEETKDLLPVHGGDRLVKQSARLWKLRV